MSPVPNFVYGSLLLAAAHSPLHTRILLSTRHLESQKGLINSQAHIMEFNAVASKSRHAKSHQETICRKRELRNMSIVYIDIQ